MSLLFDGFLSSQFYQIGSERSVGLFSVIHSCTAFGIGPASAIQQALHKSHKRDFHHLRFEKKDSSRAFHCAGVAIW